MEPRRARHVGDALLASTWALALVSALAASATTASAAARLELAAEAGADLRVVATNVGDAPASGVGPALVSPEHPAVGDAVALAPGERHEWLLPVPPPPGPGTFPVVVRVRWTDALGAHAVPVVALASTPGESPSRVQVALDAGPVGRTGHVRLHIGSPYHEALAGRVFLVLADGLSTEPESIPAQVPSEGTVIAPFVVENHGVSPGAYPAYAVFEHSAGGVRHAAVAQTTLTVGGDAGVGWDRRMLVGVTTLAAALLVALLAWRASRRA